MNHSTTVMFCACALLAIACRNPGASTAGTSRLAFRDASVVLVTIDTLRADRLGTYGSTLALTPHLDAFAREAIVFDGAVCQTPLTLPSHVTIFTGMHPARHR